MLGNGLRFKVAFHSKPCYTMNEQKKSFEEEQLPVTVRNHKDTVFRMLFREKKELLSLFNAVNGTNYMDPEALVVNTLENAVYMNMANDVSCVLDMELNLYEHQSTVNPNMPLRDLFYVSRMYETMVEEGKIYATKAVGIPAPKFVVFYNGIAKQPERKCFYLSDLYVHKSEGINLELVVIQLNISPGFNEELKRNCPSLMGYMQFVEKVRKNQKSMKAREAIDVAVTECIKEGVLVDFLRKNRAEVVQMSIFEYDQEAHMRVVREEERDRINELVRKLMADGRIDELQRSTTDLELQTKLLKEYGLLDEE